MSWHMYKCSILLDGNWSDWGNWTACSKTCGGGTQERNRSCTNPAPAYGGLDCDGPSTGTRKCNSFPCFGNLFKSCKIGLKIILKFDIHKEKPEQPMFISSLPHPVACVINIL